MNNQQSLSPAAGTMNRRGIVKWAIALFSGILAAIIGWPLVASLVGPIYLKGRGRFAKVVGLDTVPQGMPVEVSFPYLSEDAFVREKGTHRVWVIKHSSSNVTVFSPICPHLGCRFEWHSDLDRFICPCHGSVFTITGKVVGGPSPRPLDTLPHKIENGELFVEWERFEVGIPEKVIVSY